MVGCRPYSILTNFGCHWLCPYCIVRNNDIGIEETDTGKVDETVNGLIKDGSLGFLSLSGGGDPMFQADDDRMDWYESLSARVHDTGSRFELHTSYKRSILNRRKVDFDVISYHCQKKEQLGTINRVLDEKVRAVFVVQDFMDEDYVLSIADEVGKSDTIDQLSFRQRVDSGYRLSYHLHGFLESGHGNEWFYIRQGDYNNYIVNDKVSDRYEDFVEESTE